MAPISLADVIANRTSVSLARSQRLVSSWLPPPPPQDSEIAKSSVKQEQADVFTPEPELRGLGRQAPKDEGLGASNGVVNSQEEQLRKRLLGKGAPGNKRKRNDQFGLERQDLSTKKPRSVQSSQKRMGDSDMDDDEDVGRSAVGNPRKPSAKVQNNSLNDGEDLVREDENEFTDWNGLEDDPTLGKPTNYLDIVLAEKARKRNKKKRKRRKKQDAESDAMKSKVG
ncbi:uncharacterized protein KY384_005385 [Bacidia gigantensis]|uniref:uncharacterized protein n=1 Tax=Bacidia gigantensis TaxID=2732470 RepID=UPI001D044966|nr:uncharacterized protein KY384_005385 [Bacidia gigantensis]KAG8529904.1 hypothetical protein KY384_005385 [Bacidia gigantensis]